MKLRVLSEKEWAGKGWDVLLEESGIPEEDWDDIIQQWFFSDYSNSYNYYKQKVIPKYTKLAMYLRGF